LPDRENPDDTGRLQGERNTGRKNGVGACSLSRKGYVKQQVQKRTLGKRRGIVLTRTDMSKTRKKNHFPYGGGKSRRRIHP